MKNESRQHHAKDSKIMPCNCKHEYQDQKHGAGNRVHNPAKDGVYRCTVCGQPKNTK